MKALITIEIPDDHLVITCNDLYDRLKGYKCELIPVPKYDPDKNGYFDECEKAFKDGFNACLSEIENG